MRNEPHKVPVPTNHFLACIRIFLPACSVVAYHVEPVGKRWAFGSSVRSAERNPVPGERNLFLMEPRVPTRHDPVITLGHGRILSDWKAFQLAAWRAFWVKIGESGRYAVNRRGTWPIGPADCFNCRRPRNSQGVLLRFKTICRARFGQKVNPSSAEAVGDRIRRTEQSSLHVARGLVSPDGNSS
jgi:hypothetical protein